jgi:hypothetical protein
LRPGDPSRAVCPNKTNPLHFFVASAAPVVHDSGSEAYVFRCTACESTLYLQYRIPRLSKDYHDLLTDPGRLKRRLIEAQKTDSGRTGLEQQAGIKVIEALSTYIRDALANDAKKTLVVPLHNKRFMSSFGTDCDSLLMWLGFRKQTTDTHEEWRIPQPPEADPLADEKAPRVILEDVMEELYAKMRKYTASQLATLKTRPPPATPFLEALGELLSSNDYGRGLWGARTREPDDDSPYAGLGAAQDFTNELLLYSFRRQVDWYPEASSYYYDCFSMVANKRRDDDLNIKTAMLASEGYFSREDVAAAYRYLGLQDSAGTATDDQILGTFEARLENSPRNQEAELREKLRVIGVARGSLTLTNAAENGKSPDFFSKPPTASPKRKPSSQRSSSLGSPKRLKIGDDTLDLPAPAEPSVAAESLVATEPLPMADPDPAIADAPVEAPKDPAVEQAMVDLGMLEEARLKRAELQFTRPQLAGLNPRITFTRDSLSPEAEADDKATARREDATHLLLALRKAKPDKEDTVWGRSIVFDVRSRLTASSHPNRSPGPEVARLDIRWLRSLVGSQHYRHGRKQSCGPARPGGYLRPCHQNHCGCAQQRRSASLARPRRDPLRQRRKWHRRSLRFLRALRPDPDPRPGRVEAAPGLCPAGWTIQSRGGPAPLRCHH